MSILKSKKKKQSNTVIITVITVVCGCLSILAVGQIPVAVTLSEIPIDSTMNSYGPITNEHPLNECLMFSSAKSGVPNNDNAEVYLELYMATYMQAVDSDYQVTINGQSPSTLLGSSVQDNAYERVMTLDSSTLAAQQMCLHIKPVGSPVHPLTIWLDSQKRPVSRLKSKMTLVESIEYLSEQSQFHLGKELIFGLCLAYILGLMGFSAIICSSLYEQKRQKQEPQTKHEYHSGAGNKRI